MTFYLNTLFEVSRSQLVHHVLHCGNEPHWVPIVLKIYIYSLFTVHTVNKRTVKPRIFNPLGLIRNLFTVILFDISISFYNLYPILQRNQTLTFTAVHSIHMCLKFHF